MPWVDEFTDTFSDIFGKKITSTYSVVGASFDPAFPADFFPGEVIVNPPPVTVQTRERARYALFVRDGNRVIRGQVGDYISATLTPRWGLGGQWSVTLARATTAADLFLAPRSGIYVTRDEQPFFSGPATSKELSLENGESTLVVSGVDDTALLSWRLAMPEPSNPMPPYVTNDHDLRIGATSTVIWQYVNVNMGPSAVGQRRIPGLVMAVDPGVGTTVTAQGKYQQLDGFVQQLAAASTPEIGYTVKQVGATLTFTVSAARDNRAKAVFSKELGNVTAYQYTQTAGANYAVGGGSGDSIDRVIVEQPDTGAIVEWGRIESFNDHSDQDTLEGMQTLLSADLAVSAETSTVTFTLADTSNLKFGVDFDLGDLVTVLIEGQPLTEIMREATITLDKDAAVTAVTVSTPGVAPTAARSTLIAAIRAMRKELRELQRIK